MSVDDLLYASLIGEDNAEFGLRAAFYDFDGDDLTDLVVSADTDSTDVEYGGALYFFSDVASVLTTTGIDPREAADAVVLGQREWGLLGVNNIVPMGDLDSGGRGDLLVKEIGFGSSPNEPLLYILGGELLDGVTTPDEAAILAWDAPNTLYSGFSFASGDFDGDGYGDIVIGQCDYPTGRYPETGKVYIYLTSDYGL